MSLFLCLSGILLERCYQKNVVKSGGFRKKIKKGGWPYRGGGVYRRKGDSNLHTMKSRQGFSKLISSKSSGIGGKAYFFSL